MAINSKTNRSPPTGAPWELTAEDWNTLWDQVQMARGANYGTVQDNSTVLATGSITARKLSDRFADVANVLDFGALNDGTAEAATTAGIRAALAAGAGGVVFFPAGEYLVDTSSGPMEIPPGTSVLGDSATIRVKTGVINGSVFVVGWNGGVFEAGSGYLIDGFTFIGQADGSRASTPYAICVAAAHDYSATAGICSDITVTNCKATGFCFGVISTGAHGLSVRGCSFGGNKYIQDLGAGGYGVLVQSGDDIQIDGNTFVASDASATTGDRHAIYISLVKDADHAIGSTIVPCSNVRITNNFIDWTDCTPASGFSHCAVSRFFRNMIVSGNKFVGGVAAFVVSCEEGAGENLTIENNVISGFTGNGVNEVSAITFGGGDGGTTLGITSFVISGNIISWDGGTGTAGIAIYKAWSGCVSGNVIRGVSALRGIYVVECERVAIEGNILNGVATGAGGIVFEAGTASSNICVQGNVFSGFATDVVANSVPTGSRIDIGPEKAVSGATPSVEFFNSFLLTQSGATNVTNLTGGYDGKVVRVFTGDAYTTFKQGNFYLKGATDFVAPVQAMIVFVFRAARWIEVSRSEV